MMESLEEGYGLLLAARSLTALGAAGEPEAESWVAESAFRRNIDALSACTGHRQKKSASESFNDFRALAWTPPRSHTFPSPNQQIPWSKLLEASRIARPGHVILFHIARFSAEAQERRPRRSPHVQETRCRCR